MLFKKLYCPVCISILMTLNLSEHSGAFRSMTAINKYTSCLCAGRFKDILESIHQKEANECGHKHVLWEWCASRSTGQLCDVRVESCYTRVTPPSVLQLVLVMSKQNQSRSVSWQWTYFDSLKLLFLND